MGHVGHYIWGMWATIYGACGPPYMGHVGHHVWGMWATLHCNSCALIIDSFLAFDFMVKLRTVLCPKMKLLFVQRPL